MAIDRGRSIRDLIRIKDQDPATMTPHLYDQRNRLAEDLFGTVSIHDAFAHRYPEFCLSTVIWMTRHGDVSTLTPDATTQVYSSDHRHGGTIRVYPDMSTLARCLDDAAYDPNGVYLYFDDHSNVVWLDPTSRHIHRYDPQISGDDPEEVGIDAAMSAFFASILPTYTYFGNTLHPEACIQDVRYRHRGRLDCFCQEYTLLYAWNRLSGMSHLEAAQDLVASEDTILDRIYDFYSMMTVETNHSQNRL